MGKEVQLRLIDFKDDKGRACFQLLDDYHYDLGPGCTITVPKGYITNFGTIPRPFWWFIAPSELSKAAIVHDYLCNEDVDPNDGDHQHSGYSRWFADAVLYEAMARLGFGWFKRACVFGAVRLASIFVKQKWPPPPEQLELKK